MHKILVALSGGVDSAAAAFLLREQGYDCAGAMMKLFPGGNTAENDARDIAARLGMPYYILDCMQEFQQIVIDPFVGVYQNGLTPNPCIQCNRHMKFGLFLRRARELGYDFIATGHYARVERGGAGERHLLKKGADTAKDQSYVLYTLTQEQLGRTLFPLGALSKPRVRALAESGGFVDARKPESQDICFVPDGEYAAFITKHTGRDSLPGRFVDTAGRDLGAHKGLIHYTVGQRRGLGLPAEDRLYVKELRPSDNTVVVGAAETLYETAVYAKDINLIPLARLDRPMRVRARLRYKHPEQPATVWQMDEDTLRVEFDSPQRAVAPGQAVVLYDGDVVVGGGTIMRKGSVDDDH